MRQRWQSGDSLELDDGADLQDSLGSGTNMVIQMGQVWTNNIQIAKFCQTQGVVQKTITGKSLSSRQDCYRVLVSIISWPGQLLSLNPCQRPKILARMLFWGILSLTVVILEITAYLIRDCDYWGKQTNA